MLAVVQMKQVELQEFNFEDMNERQIGPKVTYPYTHARSCLLHRREHLKYFPAQRQQQNRTIKNISSTSRLEYFFQKDAHFIIKLHIQVYPCNHVLECR